MEQRVGIADTSCLIGLSKVQMETLPLQLYSEVIIPPAVQEEFGSLLAGYISLSPSNHLLVQTLRLILGAGEAEVIPIAQPKFTKTSMPDNPLLKVPPARRGNRTRVLPGSPREAGGT